MSPSGQQCSDPGFCQRSRTTEGNGTEAGRGETDRAADPDRKTGRDGDGEGEAGWQNAEQTDPGMVGGSRQASAVLSRPPGAAQNSHPNSLSKSSQEHGEAFTPNINYEMQPELNVHVMCKHLETAK